MRRLMLFANISAGVLMSQPVTSVQDAGLTPGFRDYPVTEVFTGAPADPIFTSAEQRRYRTRIREGVAKGRGVWSGGWKDNPVETREPNFAGHYYVIRWGCGSQSLMMAVVDAVTGSVYGSPLTGDGTSLYVSMDPLSDFDIDFHRDSSLMVLRNGCAKARAECGVYYFNWRGDRFVLLKRTLLDLTKAQSNR
jgi:hypothetical protein